MAIEEGVVLVGVKPDLSTFGKDVGTGVTKSVSGIKSTLSTVGKTLGVGLGAAFVVNFGKQAVAAAEEARKVAAQTDAVIKSTGGVAGVTAEQVADYAQHLSDLTAVDDDVIQSTENMLLTFTNVQNKLGEGNDVLFQATALATDMAAALGGDATSQALQLGKALNDPIKGISALTRNGVTFTEQQKAQIAELVKENDLLGAQKIILGEVRKEFGGSAEEQATGLDRLKLKWDNFKETVGSALLPVLDFIGNNTALVLSLVGAGGVLYALVKVSKMIKAVSEAFILLRDSKLAVAAVNLATTFIGEAGALVSLAASEGLASIATLELGAAFTTLGASIAIPIAAAAALGLAIGWLINKIPFVHDLQMKLADALVDNSINSKESVDEQGEAYTGLAERVKAGTITQEEYTEQIGILNEKYGAGQDAAANWAMLTDDAGDAANTATKKVKHLGMIVSMNKKKFQEWAVSTGESVESFVDGITKGERTYHGSANGFIHDLHRQERAYANYAHDIGRAENILKGKHQDFLASLEQDPNQLHAFVQASRGEQREWTKQFEETKDAHNKADGAIESTQNKLQQFGQTGSREVEGVTGKVQDLHGELNRVSASPYDVEVNYKATNLPPQPGGFDGNPKTPYPAAFGGLFHARPGGYVVRVAEAGRDEMIMPIDHSKFAGGGTGGSNMHITIGLDSDANLVVRKVIRDEMDRSADYNRRVRR